MWAISPSAKTIATPTRRLVAASSEWMSVAGSTASRLTAKSALAAKRGASHSRHDAHRRDLRDDDEDVLTRNDSDLGGADGVWAFAKGGRMLENNV